MNELEDVAPHGLHRLNHRVILRLLADNGVAHMLTVQVVNLEQVLEDVLEIVQVDEASALSDALIDLDNVIDSLYILMAKELIDVGISVG